ncbi:serine hydrolase domain-containing protein [Streptomyces parvulus]|uniref:serine hydrolase domain-containing protein n=1 Tax=Streptomyces parvulus TaxID=146923 RepID=UPI003EB6F98E
MTTSQDELLPATRRQLLHRIAVAQAEGRTPSLVAAVVRDGRTVWHGARTSVEGHGPDENVQYRIGSITKTFTAVLVLRLRDEGLLDLGDPLEKHLPGTGAGEATIAELLAHSGGLAAESPAPWWERTPGSLRPELADVLGKQPFLHPVGRRHHYSNPGYTLLGALVAQVRGASWEEVLRREVLEPLGLHRTSTRPSDPHAGGWAVHPWADVMLPEPAEDLGRMAPAGQLWSTTGDLARFAVFRRRGTTASSAPTPCGRCARLPPRWRPPTSRTARRTDWDSRSSTGTGVCSWGTPAPCPASWPTSPSPWTTTSPRWC